MLGKVTDPISNSRAEIRSPVDGRVIGMALNQSMRPGYAAYHIGIRKTEEQLLEEVGTDVSSGMAEEESVAGEQDTTDTDAAGDR